MALPSLRNAYAKLYRILGTFLDYSRQGGEVIVYRMPDPDSSEMGMWVDRWLQALRGDGAGSQELGRAVRELAEALSRGDWNSSTAQRFLRFIQQ